MTATELKNRTKRFAVTVIRFYRKLPRTEEGRVIGRQLLRAGTAVGAAYRAVCRCKSDPDFIAKLGTCIEEADESGYWLELSVEASLINRPDCAALLRESDELTRIFVASRETVRRRVRAKNQARSRTHNQESRIKNQE
jgi:four helix bundle protein